MSWYSRRAPEVSPVTKLARFKTRGCCEMAGLPEIPRPICRRATGRRAAGPKWLAGGIAERPVAPIGKYSLTVSKGLRIGGVENILERSAVWSGPTGTPEMPLRTKAIATGSPTDRRPHPLSNSARIRARPNRQVGRSRQSSRTSARGNPPGASDEIGGKHGRYDRESVR